MKKFYYTYYIKEFETLLTIYEEDNYITKISFEHNADKSYIKKQTSTIEYCASQLHSYFYGKLMSFDIKYKLPSYTDFQKKIINIVNDIPYGQTMSYSQISDISGHKNASRAVGSVMANNMLPIIIPCHRVVRSDGKIGEYLGGSNMKKMLLDMENTNKKKEL